MLEPQLMPKCEDCSTPENPAYYNLDSEGTLKCLKCSKIYKTKFKEEDGVEYSKGELIIDASPGDQLYVAVICENNNGEVVNVTRQRLLDVPYTGGVKRVKRYEIVSNHILKVYY